MSRDLGERKNDRADANKPAKLLYLDAVPSIHGAFVG
jgi:hypothetical protein